jgi:hypothetical protein
VQVSYQLQDRDGDPVGCATAGVARVRLRLFAARQDATPALEATPDCAVDDAGAGVASAEHERGFFDSARVALLDADGEVVRLASGTLSEWEYLTVEITGNGVTDLVPAPIAVFDATGAP